MVKLKLLLLLTYFGVISLASAQEITPLSQKDSVEYLVALAEKKMDGDPVYGGKLARRAHILAVETRYATGEAKALFTLGKYLRAVNKNEEAIDSYLKAARLFESLNDSSYAGRSYTGATGVYIFKLLHYTKAYQYCTKAVSLLQHDSVHLPYALSNLAALQLQSGKSDEAFKLYQEVYEIHRRQNELQRMCVALSNIASVYVAKGDFKSSVPYFKKAIEMSKALGEDMNTAHALLGISPAYCTLQDHKKAKEALEEAFLLTKKRSLFDKQVKALQYLAAESQHLGQLDQAIAYAHQSELIAQQHGLHFLKGSIYQLISDIYNKADKPAIALKYQQKYAQFKDSIARQERLAVASLDLHKTDNATSKRENTDGTKFQGWMIALSMIILVPGMFFIFYKKRKEKENWSDAGVDASVSPHPGRLSADEGTEAAPDSEGLQKETHPEASETALQHLEVINGEGIKLLPLNNIWWFQKEGKNYHAFTETGNYRVRQNITELEQALPRNRFFRINRAVIINTEQMSNYSFWENHKYIIRMKDAGKSEFVISRNRLREMKETFQVIEGS